MNKFFALTFVIALLISPAFAQNSGFWPSNRSPRIQRRRYASACASVGTQEARRRVRLRLRHRAELFSAALFGTNVDVGRGISDLTVKLSGAGRHLLGDRSQSDGQDSGRAEFLQQRSRQSQLGSQTGQAAGR